MKHIITMTACLMVLMALLSQFVHNQQLLMKVESGSYAVDVFCKDKNEHKMRETLSKIFDCNREDVLLEVENGMLRISTPVKEILAVPEFWGIEPTMNYGVYRWERQMENE